MTKETIQKMHSFKLAEFVKRKRIKHDGLVTLEQLVHPEGAAMDEDDLMCTICFDMIHDARECPKCHQKFCFECIKGAQNVIGKICPMRCACPAGGVQSDNEFRAMIDNFMFKCQNEENGCQWQGTQKEHKSHIEKDCAFVKETCTACKTMIYRQDFEQHKTECPGMPFDCVHCYQKDIKRCDLDKHLQEECPEVYIKCEFCNKKYKRRMFADHWKQCGSEIISCDHCDYPVARKNMVEHLSKTCLEIKVNCTNEGCSKQISRGDLDAHLQECQQLQIQEETKVNEADAEVQDDFDESDYDYDQEDNKMPLITEYDYQEDNKMPLITDDDFPTFG